MSNPGTRISAGAVRSRATAVVVYLLTAFTVGCGGPASQQTASASKKDLAEKAGREADELLNSVQGILSSTPDSHAFPTVLKQLNQYLDRRAEEVEPLDEAARDNALRLFGPGGLAEIDRAEFSSSDLEYVRGCIFLNGVTRHLRRGAESDLKYAQALFDWVVRYVQLEPNEARTGGTPLEICLRGSGSANERSWVFLELLRQAGLRGCVVGIPSAENAGRIVPWLCGLFADEHVYLFDPTIGLPVPSGHEGVATLDELGKNPALLEEAFSFGDGLAYPISAANSKRYSILLILEPVMMAPRMRFLQERLTGSGRAELFVDAGAWQERAFAALEEISDDGGVHLWQYPKQQRDRHLLNDRAVWSTMNVAWLLIRDSPRLLQLQGDHEQAVQRYAVENMRNSTPTEVNVFLASNRIPPRMRVMTVARSGQDIPYFLGVSKLDLRRPDPVVASNWFRRYLSRFDSPPLRPGDVLDWSRFAKQLGAEKSDPPNGTLDRIRSLLSEETKAGIGELAARQEQARKSKKSAQANGQAAAGSFAVDKGNEEERSVIADLNELLDRKDLKRTEDPPVVAQDAELRSLLGADPQTLSERQMRPRNRLLLEAAFPGSIVHAESVWIPGAIRHLALALRAQGKSDEAIRLLEQGHPDLEPTHLLGLRALARSWRDEQGRGE